MLIDEILTDPKKGQSDMMHYKDIIARDKSVHREKVRLFMNKFEDLIYNSKSDKI